MISGRGVHSCPRHNSQLARWAIVTAVALIALAGTGTCDSRQSALECQAPCRLSLDGDWRFREAALVAADQYSPGIDDSEWTQISVPSNWYLQGHDFSGAAWYRTHVRLAPHLTGTTIRLEFDGVDYAADVWLNGKYIGYHEGYFQPFAFDVSDTIQPGKDNVLAVRVDSPFEEPGRIWSLHKRLIKGIFSHHDTRPGGAWSVRGQEKNTGGIWNSVHLAVTRGIWIESARITSHTVPEGGTADLSLSLDVNSRGAITHPLEFTVLIEPDNFPGKSTAVLRRTTIAKGRSDVALALRVPQARLWWPVGHGSPNLYRVTISILNGGEVLDRLQTRFGIRTVEYDEAVGAWKINGRRLFLRGTNYIPTQWLAEMHRSEYLRDVRLMLAANINAVRVHAHVGAEAFYRVCDEAGILIWQDFPLQWGYEDTPSFRSEATRQALDMVRAFYNHPAIIAWSLHNEPPWDAGWMRDRYPDYDAQQDRALDDALYATVRAADATRHVHHHSATAEHYWQGWYFGRWTDLAKPTHDPLITEFGAQALPGMQSLQRIVAVPADWPPKAAQWAKWEYHNFQPHETFELAGIAAGANLEEFIRNSQRYQARSIQLAAESFRRQRFAPVGAIFQFMFVEGWPSINWGIVDYWRNPKAGYHALALAYQPVLPSIGWSAERFEPGKPVSFGFWAINDRWERFPDASFRYEITGARGEYVFSGLERVDLEPDSLRKVADIARLELEAGAYVVSAVISDTTGTILGTNSFEFDVAACRECKP